MVDIFLVVRGLESRKLEQLGISFLETWSRDISV